MTEQPDVRTLTPPISFLAEPPAIDGRMNAGKARLPVREFHHIIKGDPANPVVPVTCRLAYGAEFLYVLIEVEAESFVCRDRGYQNGDGVLVMLATPRPGEAASPENYILGFWPRNDGVEPVGTLLWAHDGDWPMRRMGEGVRFVVRADGGRVFYELLLPWEEVPPYHPWLSERIGGEVAYVQAVGDDQITWYCMALDDWARALPQAPYVLLEFEGPALGSGARTYVLPDRTGYQGRVLHARSATLAAEPATEGLVLTLVAGEGEPLAAQRVAYACQPGLSVHGFHVETEDLLPGGYQLRWRSTLHPVRGSSGISILPAVDLVAESRRLDALRGNLSPGSRTTLQFQLEALASQLGQVKPHETHAALRIACERYGRLVGQAERGEDALAHRTGFFRRAFRSELDASLQPYTVRIPEDLGPGRRYPLLVFLHGSDSDDTSLVHHAACLAPENWIVVGPYGRGRSNAYTRDHAQIDIQEAVDDACRHYPVDRDCIVLAGFSMGGYGVYRTYWETPGRYRGLAVLSGIPDEGSAALPGEEHPNFLREKYLAPFRDVPLFIFHGSEDRNAPFAKTEQLVQKLRTLGATVAFYVQEGGGHAPPDEAGTRAYYAWLEALYRAAADAV